MTTFLFILIGLGISVFLLFIGHIKFLSNPMFSFILGGWIGFKLFEVSFLIVLLPLATSILMLLYGKFITDEALKTKTSLSGFFISSTLGVVIQFFI